MALDFDKLMQEHFSDTSHEVTQAHQRQVMAWAADNGLADKPFEVQERRYYAYKQAAAKARKQALKCARGTLLNTPVWLVKDENVFGLSADGMVAQKAELTGVSKNLKTFDIRFGGVDYKKIRFDALTTEPLRGSGYRWAVIDPDPEHAKQTVVAFCRNESRQFIGWFNRISESALKPQKRVESLALLGLDETADKTAIKTAYRQLCKQHHPDIGGDRTRFEQLTGAYEFLTAG